MARPRARRSAFLALLATFTLGLLSGCRAPLRAKGPAVITVQHGVETRWPCRVLSTRGDVVMNHVRCDVATFEPGAAPSGNYRGISGAPVVDGDGKLLGSASKSPGDPGDRLFAMVPADTLRSTLELARARCPVGETATVTLGPAVIPGQSVAVLTIWGDLTLGPWGCISLVDGQHALAFGHPDESLAMGPVSAEVFDAPVLAVAAAEGEAQSICSIGQPLGRAEFNSPTGVTVHLGSHVPALALRFQYTLQDTTPIGQRDYWVVSDAPGLASRIQQVLNDALSQLSGVPGRRVLLQASGDTEPIPFDSAQLGIRKVGNATTALASQWAERVLAESLAELSFSVELQ